MGGYDEAYRYWQLDPEGFWQAASSAIDWDRPPEAIVDRSRDPRPSWFPGGELNTCFNALDRHVRDGRGEQAALIYDSPVTGVVRHFSYRELLDEVARFAGALAREGVVRGDRVVIYMPMVPEAVIAMLACARLGAIHSVVFGGFGADELAARINDSGARIVVCASCGVGPPRVVEYKPLVDSALELLDGGPRRCVVLQRPEAPGSLQSGRDVEWSEFVEGAEPAECVPVAASDPLYILYTSGTTGLPKGIVRDNGGHAVALKWSMDAIYDVRPGEVYWAASDIGWVVGHSYIVYAPLLARVHDRSCTRASRSARRTPARSGASAPIIASMRMFTAPTAIRAIKREDPDGEQVQNYDLSSPRTLFLAGERCDPDTLDGRACTSSVPVIDHWWQTESGWPMAANCVGLEPLPVKPGLADQARARLRDPRPRRADVARTSRTARLARSACVCRCRPASRRPCGEASERFVDAYLSRYEGYYLTGDAGYFDDDGYLYVMSRIDDVINTAGHRLSTGQMEEVLASHHDIAECAVVGVADDYKGQVPIGFAVLKAGVERPREEVAAELVALVRERVGPVASFKTVAIVDALAEDPLREDAARHDPQHGRRRGVERPADDRGSGRPGSVSRSCCRRSATAAPRHPDGPPARAIPG